MTGPRRRMPREQRRATLIDAAREEVLARGYGELTMERVARRAGVSKTLVYDHFANRRDLFLAVLGEEHVRLMAAVAPAVAHGDRETRVRAGVRAFLTVADAYGGGGFAELFRNPVAHDPELAAEVGRIRDGLAGLIASVIAGEIGRPVQAGMLPAHAIVGAMDEAAVWFARTPAHERPPMDVAAPLLAKLVWQGLEGVAAALEGVADGREPSATQSPPRAGSSAG